MRTVVVVLALVACDDRDGRVPCLAPTPICAPDDVEPDASPVDCDPVAQVGCAATEKCTWSLEEVRTVCSPLGGNEVAIGASCSADPLTTDTCVRGGYCFEATCRTMCDPNVPLPASGCTQEEVCVAKDGLFVRDGMTFGGLCEPA